MGKWEALCLSVLFVSIAGANAFNTYQSKQVEIACYNAVAAGKGQIKDCI